MAIFSTECIENTIIHCSWNSDDIKRKVGRFVNCPPSEGKCIQSRWLTTNVTRFNYNLFNWVHREYNNSLFMGLRWHKYHFWSQLFSCCADLWQSLQCFSFESNQIVGKSSLFVVSVVASMVLLSKACAVFHHGRYKETTSHPIFGQFHYLNIISKFFDEIFKKKYACLEISCKCPIGIFPVPDHDSIVNNDLILQLINKWTTIWSVWISDHESS